VWRVVTSPAAQTPAQTAARHRAEISGLRRWTRIILIVGTVLSLACAAGPVWLVRLGLLPALGAALGSCWLAWREIGLERRAHASAMLAASRRHGAQLTEERRHNTAVLAAMTGRVEAFTTLAGSRAATIHRLDAELTRLSGDVNGLRGANGRLTRDLNFRDATIAGLRETVERRDTELAALRAAEGPDSEIHDAEVRELRSLDPDAEPADDVRQEADVLQENGAERRTADFLSTQLVAMPNYEEDRRFA
jgi:hypothetical protein